MPVGEVEAPPAGASTEEEKKRVQRQFRAALLSRYGSLRGAFSAMNLDANRFKVAGSTVVSEEELKSSLLLMGMGGWVDTLLQSLDSNRDGNIDLRELLALEDAGAVVPEDEPVRPLLGGAATRQRKQPGWNPLGQNGAGVKGWDPNADHLRVGGEGRRRYNQMLKRDARPRDVLDRGCGARGCCYCWRGDVAKCRQVQDDIDRRLQRDSLTPFPEPQPEPPKPRPKKVENHGPLSPSMADRRPPKAWPGGFPPSDSFPAELSADTAWQLYFPTAPLRADSVDRGGLLPPPAEGPAEPGDPTDAELYARARRGLETERSRLHIAAADFYRRQGRAPALVRPTPPPAPFIRARAASERAKRVLSEPPEALVQMNYHGDHPRGVCSIAPSVHLARDEFAVEPDGGDEAGFQNWGGWAPT